MTFSIVRTLAFAMAAALPKRPMSASIVAESLPPTRAPSSGNVRSATEVSLFLRAVRSDTSEWR